MRHSTTLSERIKMPKHEQTRPGIPFEYTDKKEGAVPSADKADFASAIPTKTIKSSDRDLPVVIGYLDELCVEAGLLYDTKRGYALFTLRPSGNEDANWGAQEGDMTFIAYLDGNKEQKLLSLTQLHLLRDAARNDWRVSVSYAEDESSDFNAILWVEVDNDSL